MEQERQVIIIKQSKSVGVAIILTILLGPIGMFYSTIIGATLMCIVSLFVGALTAGFGLILTWPICIIWAAAAAAGINHRDNKKYKKLIS